MVCSVSVVLNFLSNMDIKFFRMTSIARHSSAKIVQSPGKLHMYQVSTSGAFDFS